jgi:hypothetical protein
MAENPGFRGPFVAQSSSMPPREVIGTVAMSRCAPQFQCSDSRHAAFPVVRRHDRCAKKRLPSAHPGLSIDLCGTDRRRWLSSPSTLTRPLNLLDRIDNRCIGGIVRAEKGVLYDIGGVEDHVHLYLRWPTDASISDLTRSVKARSSKWVHETFPRLGSFAWQEGWRASAQRLARADRLGMSDEKASTTRKEDSPFPWRTLIRPVSRGRGILCAMWQWSLQSCPHRVAFHRRDGHVAPPAPPSARR